MNNRDTAFYADLNLKNESEKVNAPDFMDWGITPEEYQYILSLKRQEDTMPDVIWLGMMLGQIAAVDERQCDILEAASRLNKLRDILPGLKQYIYSEVEGDVQDSMLAALARQIALTEGVDCLEVDILLAKYLEKEQELLLEQQGTEEEQIGQRVEVINRDLPEFLFCEEIFVARRRTNVFINDAGVESREFFDILAEAGRNVVVLEEPSLSTLLARQLIERGLISPYLISVGGAGDITTAMLAEVLINAGGEPKILDPSELSTVDTDVEIVVVDDVLKTGGTIKEFIRKNNLGQYENLAVATWLTAYYKNGATAYGLDWYVPGGVFTGIVYDGLEGTDGRLPVNSISTLLKNDSKARVVVSDLDRKYFDGKLRRSLESVAGNSGK